MKYLLLSILWILWCAVHSGMISITVTTFLKTKLGTHYRYYRFFFNITALITLLPLVLFSHALQSTPFFVWNGSLRIIQILLLTIAVVLFLVGSRHYDAFQFLGLPPNAGKKPHSVLTGSGRLNTRGILGMVRHPWYAGALVLIWARHLDISAMIVNIILTVYIFIGTFLEEKKLLQEFGDGYRAYQAQVSPFFPSKWLLSKIKH